MIDTSDMPARAEISKTGDAKKKPGIQTSLEFLTKQAERLQQQTAALVQRLQPVISKIPEVPKNKEKYPTTAEGICQIQANIENVVTILMCENEGLDELLDRLEI